MVCSKCGKDAGDSNFCPECGAPVTEMLDESLNSSNNNEKPKKKKGKGCIIAVVAFVATIGIIIGGISIVAKKLAADAEKERISEEARKASLIDIVDSTVCLYVEDSTVWISNHYISLKNTSEKTIENLSITISLLNSEGIEKNRFVQ